MGNVVAMDLISGIITVVACIVWYRVGLRNGYNKGVDDTTRYLQDVGMDEDTFESYMKGN